MTKAGFLGAFLLAAVFAAGAQEGVHSAIRKAESEFVKYHLEATGKHPPSARFAIDPSLDAACDEYRIVSEGKSVAFLGANPRAVLYAVYDFLSRRAGCRWYWDGDVVPKTGQIDFSGLDVREKSRFEYRAIRYFAHRGLTRFQAEHWGLEDWKREIDWCAKRRLNTVMMRLGDEDAFQKAFPETVPYPDPRTPSKMTGFNNRALFWPLEYRGRLRKAVREYATSLGLMMPEDFGTMTHWYSRTPEAFLEKMKPPFLPQEAGNYREDSGRVWDVRDDKWLDAYFRLTEAQIADGASPALLHTIGLGERRAFTNRAENLKLKMDVIHRLVNGAHKRWPQSKVLLAGWDFFGTWRSDEVRALFASLDPRSVILWDYEGDSPIKRYGNLTEWGVVGKFPYTFGFFVNSAAGCDIRFDYGFVERRGAQLAEDPFCRGFILWPEASHIDPFMLEWFVENAWRPYHDRSVLLDAFCRGRYASAAPALEKCWKELLSLPLASYECWGGNLANRAPYDVVSFTPAFNAPTAPGWALARELPLFASAPGIFRSLAGIPATQEMAVRDIVDIARTLADRLILRARAELAVSYHRWRTTGEGVARVEELAAAFESIGAHFADLLEQHTDYSLNESLERLNAVEPVANPSFDRVLVDNATCSYCRSHQYEAARHWYAPCMRDLARFILEKTALDARVPVPVKAFAENSDDYRKRMLGRPLSEMAPSYPRTAGNLRTVLLQLAADADRIVAAAPTGVARRPPDWFSRGTFMRAQIDVPALERLADAGVTAVCVGEATGASLREFTAAAHSRGMRVLQTFSVPEKVAPETLAALLCGRVRDGGVDGFILAGTGRLALDKWAFVRSRLAGSLPDVVLVSDDRRAEGLLDVFDAVADAAGEQVFGRALRQEIALDKLKIRYAADRSFYPAATRILRHAEEGNSPRAQAGAFLRLMLDGVCVLSEPLPFLKELSRLKLEDPFYSEMPVVWLKNDKPGKVLSFERRDANRGGVLALVNTTGETVRVRVDGVDASAVVPSVVSGCSSEAEVFVLDPYGFFAGELRKPF